MTEMTPEAHVPDAVTKVARTAPWCPECGPTCPLHGTADYDAATVCIAHGRFIPCRKDGEHRYTSNPYWAKAVMDYQGSPIEDLTWQPAWSSQEAP